jgi:MFS family permease
MTTKAPFSVEPGAPVRSGFIALSYRNYRLFWCGQLISATGTWMQSLAQSWLVVDTLNATGFQLGLVNVFQIAPVLLLGIPAGVIADRIPKQKLLLMTQSMFAILAAVLTALVATNRIELWHVFAVAACFGVTNAFDMPTRQAFVSELVGKEALANAIALNSALFNTGRILGPAIAGAILALYGPAFCFGLNSISYLAVIIGLLMMKVVPVTNQAATSALNRLREGLHYVRSTPDVLRPIILIAFVGIFGMNFNVWLPLLAKEDFDSGAAAFGMLFTSMGVGSLVGALTLALGNMQPKRMRMLVTAIALGLAEVLLAAVASVPLALVFGMALLALVGFFSSMATATANTIVQTTAGDLIRGRVMAVYMTVFAGTIPFGALISGTIADTFSGAVSLGVGGFVTMCAAIGLTFMQREARQGIIIPGNR